MSQVNRVLALSIPIRLELNERLRAAAYGDLITISAWITAKAHPISKSSLHRYAVGLKATDVARGSEAAQLALATRSGQATTEVVTGRKASLLMQLGRLEFERARLLAELAPLMIADFCRDGPETETPAPAVN